MMATDGSDFAINLYSYLFSHTAPDAVRHLSDQGYSGFEFMMFPNHLWYGAEHAATAKDLLAAQAETGARFLSSNMPNIDINIAACEFFAMSRAELNNTTIPELLMEGEPLRKIPLSNLFLESQIVPSLSIQFRTGLCDTNLSDVTLKKFSVDNEDPDDEEEETDYVLFEMRDQSELVEAVEIAETTLRAEQLVTEHLHVTIDELTTTQEQLIQAEKLSSLGKLVAGVAHELNNPMNFIRSNFDLALKSVSSIESHLSKLLTDKPEAKALWDFLIDHFEKIREAHEGHEMGVNRAQTIIKNLLDYSRQSGSEKKPVDLELLLTEVQTILRSKLKKISFDVEINAQKKVHANLHELSQVLINILDNAIYAASHGPNQSEPTVKLRCFEDPDMVYIEVSDNGPGIPDDIAASIFDPFMTTKPIGEGTGMGLSICHQIIENHHGYLCIDDSDQGAVFRISLPSRDRDAQQPR